MWGLPVVSTTAVYDRPEQLDALVAVVGDERIGAVTWSVADRAFEVVTLEVLPRRAGIGRALMRAVRERAGASGAGRVWLITTDDNPTAVAFYAAIGMEEVRRLPRFSDRVREYKPDLEIEFDAIELEWQLGTR